MASTVGNDLLSGSHITGSPQVTSLKALKLLLLLGVGSSNLSSAHYRYIRTLLLEVLSHAGIVCPGGSD